MSANEPLYLAQNFIWLNARLLERQLFAFLFAEGPREPVLAALRAYQNLNGGLGNALEPDKRCPESQPIDNEFGLEVLDQVNAFSDPEEGRPMVLRICDYLASITTPEGGIPNTLPSANGYPHAPWWHSPENPPASLNPTASILALLLKHAIRHPWVERATAYCWQAIAQSNSREYHDLMPMIAFLETVPERTRAEQELLRLADRIREPGMVSYDPLASGYVHPPLDWAPNPSSYCRRLFSDEVIARHLDALTAQQLPDGGWPISWSPLSPGVEREWCGIVTLRALRILQAYGRLTDR